MRYLHANGLIYRDLKIDNIMLNTVFQAKLIDFGLAKINECLFGEEMMNTISMTKGVGNSHFMSPEMMKMCIAIDPKERPAFEEALQFLRKCEFMLSPDVDPSIVEQRDKELEIFKFNKINE